MTLDDFKKKLIQILSDDGLKAAFDMLFAALLTSSQLLDEFITLKGSFSKFERDWNEQTITLEEYKVNTNRITKGLVSFLRDELTEQDLNLTSSNTTELSPLSIAIQELGLKKALGPAALVNCDRTEATELFSNFFMKDDATPYQFYFILGDSEQHPDRFGERLIYTIKDLLEGETDKAINFRQSDEDVLGKLVPRATVEELPVNKYKRELSKNAFKTYCDERFTLNGTLEDFITLKSRQLPYEYIAFTFKYSEEAWNPEIVAYFEWLIETFRQNKTDKPTFLFFFVIETDGIYDPEKVHSDVKALENRYAEASLVMPDLLSVPASDVDIWLKKRIQARNIDKAKSVLTAYFASKKDINPAQPIPMMELRDLQENIYVASQSVK
jgi:Effector-associated domain 11/inactive STAND